MTLLYKTHIAGGTLDARGYRFGQSVASRSGVPKSDTTGGEASTTRDVLSGTEIPDGDHPLTYHGPKTVSKMKIRA